MPSPFPGVDPYLEGQHFWEDFHPSFLTYCRDALNEILPRDYVAQLGERIRLVELSHKAVKSVRPAIAVIAETGRPSHKIKGRVKATTGTVALEPVTIPLATTYERGRYAGLIDYTTLPPVLREPEDRVWAEKLARRGRR